MQIVQGQTDPGDWQDYDSNQGGLQDGIRVEVLIDGSPFTTTPHYVWTLEGESPPGGMWRAGGVGAVYEPTSRSFKVYLNWADTKFGGGDHPMYANPLRAQAAKDLGWYVKWTAIGP